MRRRSGRHERIALGTQPIEKRERFAEAGLDMARIMAASSWLPASKLLLQIRVDHVHSEMAQRHVIWKAIAVVLKEQGRTSEPLFDREE